MMYTSMYMYSICGTINSTYTTLVCIHTSYNTIVYSIVVVLLLYGYSYASYTNILVAISSQPVYHDDTIYSYST
jgi:hypothetical protein